jgi:hypothetical protein
MKTTYIIKLSSSTNPNRSRRFLRSVCKDRITETTHPRLARAFQSEEEAQALISQIQYEIRAIMTVETYMIPTKETAQ